MAKYRTIGILGGMGPEATAELYKRLIRLYQSGRGAVDDADFPNILINSVPAEDMLNDLENRRPVIVAQLQKAAQVLETAGADFIGIPCNTATIFLKDIAASVSIPVLDITEETAKYAQKISTKKVGMLASSSTIKTKIYEDKLTKFGMTMVAPSDDEQPQVNEVIMRILAGDKLDADNILLNRVAANMKQNGADSVVLGCTELPLMNVKGGDNVTVIDTIQVLAEAIVREADKA